MQELYNHNSLFRKKYFENLSNRFIHASLAIEDMYGNLNDTSQALKLYFQSQALEYAFDIDTKEKLTINNIKEIERILTNEQYDNFRTTKVEVNGSKLERAKPQYIYMEMYQLFDNYYNIWNELDPYLREAMFHIKFLQIHPFEDGNGRTARIILIRNLCANNDIPCVITKEVKKEYYSYIENYDHDGLAIFLKKLADKELDTMTSIYNVLNDKGMIWSNNMTDEQLKRYAELKDGKVLENKKQLPTLNYPLRNLKGLLELFEHGVNTANNPELNSTRIHRILQVCDSESGDQVLYYLDSETMVVNIKGNENIFKMKAADRNINFLINDQKVLADEFEFELNNKPKIKTLK